MKGLTNILIENNIFDVWAENTSEGVIICKKSDLSLLYINRRCLSILSLGDGSQEIPLTLESIFKKGTLDIIMNGGSLKYDIRETIIEINSVEVGSYLLILTKDLTEVANAEKRASEIRQLNKELQTIYEQYADETIFITNGTGIVEFAGAMVEKNCGAPSGYMVGKNVYSLEKEGHFSPSASVKVIESKQPEVIIQNTRIGKTLVAVGTPIFDDMGNISKVISITRDFSRLIKIGTLLSKFGENKQNEQDDDSAQNFIVTCDDKMLNIISLAKLVAAVNTTVLIFGETGTGKEVLARYIYESSARSNKPFIKVNCGAISPNIVESELFGYEPGSFTGAMKEGKIGLVEAANGGTLFLDEISELPLNQQVKLLQVLQEKSLTRVGGTKMIHVDIRVIAATNKNLEEQIKKGEFREDLFYRLNVVPITIPPLRERPDDIPLLIIHYIKAFQCGNERDMEFTKEALSKMCQYSWPGNVRELVNTVERLMITTPRPYIGVDDLPEKIRNESTNEGITIKNIMKLGDALEKTERTLIQMAIEKYGTGKKAAEYLGINQSTISKKMKRYGILNKN